MAKRTDETLHLGVDLEKSFVLEFREYCQSSESKFTQAFLLKHLIEWWLTQPPEVQEHIYRRRFERVSLIEVRTAPQSESELQSRLLEAAEAIRALLGTEIADGPPGDGNRGKKE